MNSELQKDEEVLRLHRELAAEKLRADQGWARYESANADRNALRAEKASAVQPVAAQQHAQAVLSDELIAQIQAAGVCMGYGEGIRRARAILAASQQPAAEPVAPAFPARDHTLPAEQQGIFEKFAVRRNDGSRS